MATNYEKYFGTPEKAALTLSRMRRNYGVCLGFITDVFPQDHDGDCDGCRYLNKECEAPIFSIWLQEECDD